MMDAAKFGAELAAMIRAHVAKRIEPLEQRIAELEAQVAAKPKSARDKK